MKDTAMKAYRATWESRTTKQIERELDSWRNYMDKHGRAYHWHGAAMTAPDQLSDGERVMVLKDILRERV